MKNENEKKGLLGRLIGSKKSGKSSCCSFEIEEIPEIEEKEEVELAGQNVKKKDEDS